MKMTSWAARVFLSTTFLLTVGAPAWASDGALEINQTCAVETGCFAGDSAGYPVTISAPGSYRLTSNLAIATDVNGILISSSYVTLNLGGFEIAGPGACAGTSLSLDCGGTGAGVGIVGLDVLYGVTVRNGVVRNMRLDGVGVGGAGSLGVRIEGITARHNARLGISGQDGVLARDCVAIENGNNGFDLDAGSSIEGGVAIGNFGHGVEIDDVGGVVSGTTSRANAGRGFNIVALSKFGKDNVSGNNGSRDSCGGGICTERRRFYRTSQFVDGASVQSACDPGFQPASVWDLLDVGELVFDDLRATSGGGGLGGVTTFSGQAWVVTADGPIPSCTNYSTASNSSSGTVIALGIAFPRPPGGGSFGEANGSGHPYNEVYTDVDAGSQVVRTIEPWFARSVTCDGQHRVWCVEDSR